MEQDVRDYVESVYRHCASERMGEVNEFIAKHSDPQKCILDAIALFKMEVGDIPQELRTKYISKPPPQASVDKSKKLSPRKQKMAERRNKADARNRERKGNSVLQRQLSRKEIKDQTLRNTKANTKIASLYQRDSKRKKRKSKMVKKHSPSPKRVEIVDEPQVSPLGKLSRQPSDGLPADLQKFMKNGPIVQKDDSDVQNDTEEIRSQKSRPQRTLSFDIPDENSQKGHGKGPMVEITRRKWDDSDVGSRTRRVQQYDFLGFKVREVDGLLVVYSMNSFVSPFKNWLKVADVVLSVNGMTNLTAEKLHKLQGPMTATVEKVSNVFPKIADYNIKDDVFVVKESSVIDHKEEPDIVKENENQEDIKKENESKEEIKEAEEISVVQIDTTKVSENKSSKVELLQIDAGAEQVTRENDMNLASPFSDDTSNMSENSEGGASPMVSYNSNDSNSNSRKKKKKKSKKRRRKRSKDHDARQQKRLDRIKKHFRDIRRQQGLSEDILEAQVSKDVRGRIFEVLRKKIQRVDNAKSADEVAWKKMEDILELQIDETLHGNISGLTNATSHDLVYNSIKIIFKDLIDKKNEKVDMELQDLPPIQRILQSNTSHSNLSIDGSDGGGPIPSNASDAGGVVNELTFLINESKTTIATLEGLGISTPEINERLFLERENLQNLTNQLLNALPGAGRAGRRSRENSFDRGYSAPHSPVDPRPLTPQHQTYLSPSLTQHDWTNATHENPEIMRQEIHRLRSQVAQNRPLPFANQQLPHPSQQQQMGYLARTRSHSGYLRRSSAFLQMQQNLQLQSRRSSFTSVGSNPSAYSSPNLAMQNRPRAFSADFPEFSGNPYGSHMEFPDRLRQLNPGEISAPMSHPVNPHTLNRPFSNASQPITRNNTGSSSSSDSPQENDPTRKGSMAERAAAGLSVSPRRVLARVPSMTRIGGKTQQVSPRFDASHAVSSILSSSTNTTVHIDTVDTIDDARMFDFSHAVRDISSPTSPLHALAQEGSFQIHE